MDPSLEDDLTYDLFLHWSADALKDYAIIPQEGLLLIPLGVGTVWCQKKEAFLLVLIQFEH